MRADIIALSAITAAAFSLAAHNSYARSVHMVYAKNGLRSLDDDESAIENALVEGNVTALVPFFLNMSPPSLSKHQELLAWLSKRNIIIVPAIGGDPNVTTLNNTSNWEMAKAYRNISDHIRLENLTGFFKNDPDDVPAFLDYCIGLGFTNIMLNPWPYASPGVLASFTKKQLNHIDSAFQQVDPDTWQINPKNVDNILAKLPGIQILVNYESPGPQQELSDMERTSAGSSINAFKKTLKQLGDLPTEDHLNWCPPFTASYDPLQFEPPTWDWIYGKLGKFQ